MKERDERGDIDIRISNAPGAHIISDIEALTAEAGKTWTDDDAGLDETQRVASRAHIAGVVKDAWSKGITQETVQTAISCSVGR